ncbi:MAG: hypothetical protein Q9159_004035 [Coniocarpon cinnabarinum]
MASRLAVRAIGAARPCVRPSLPTTAFRTLPAAHTSLQQHRFQSNTPSDPKTTAQSIVDALPGNTPVAKTAILSAGASLSVVAISNELYVVNEESIVLISLLSVFWGIYHYLGPAYSQWAEGYIEKMRGILNGARDDHKKAVQDRIDSVSGVGEVVQITKDLFAVSKETAQLEAQAFELEQKTALATEAKNTLDSWVRYEGQQKQRQQQELAASVIAKVEKELENPRVLKQILDQSVADIERIVAQKQ